MMDIRESIRKLIKQSTELLERLEADDDDDDDISDDIENFDKIVDNSKTIATQLKSKRAKRQLPNGNRSSGDDSRSSAKIKLVPIEKLTRNCATIVSDEHPIQLSDSDNEVPVQRAKLKPSSTDKTSKASILKSVFSTSKECASKNHTAKNSSISGNRSCRVVLKRVDLNGLVVSKGLEFVPPVNGMPTIKSSMTKTVRIDDSSEEEEDEADDFKTTKSKRTNGSKTKSEKSANNAPKISESDAEEERSSDMNKNEDETHISSLDDMSSVSKKVAKKAVSVSSIDSDDEIIESKSSRNAKKRSKAVVHSSDSSSDDDKSSNSKAGTKASAKLDSDYNDIDSSDSDNDVRESSDNDSDNIKNNKRKAQQQQQQQQKKKTTTKKKSSDNSDVESETERKTTKKKRRRIKNASDSSDNEKNASRKKLRKILDEKDLEDDTKKATREEMERKKRIEERQKLYNEYYEEEPEKIKVLDKLVLDFDEKTKEELISVDRKLVKKLKPHQGSGVKFMWDTCFESISRIDKGKGSGCILAHCMGLGKTLQVVTLVHTLLSHSEETGVEKVLVICPLSTVLNWVNEFRIWLRECADNKHIDIYEISKYKLNRERIGVITEWHTDGGVLIMGYDMYRNLSSETGKLKKREKEAIHALLVDPGPDMVVCDEGHLLKNSKTSLSKAVNRIRTLRRIVLTGTPLQNNLNEYYCMVQFVKPNLLGKYNEYLNRFVNPITNGQYEDSTPRDIQMMKKRSHILHKLLDGCVQRRDYSVLAPYLPVKHEYVVSVQLTPLQVKLYEYYIKQRPVADATKPTRSSVLFQDFQNLQRIWTHPRVLRFNSDRYEVQEQRRRLEMSDDEESEGSLKDFIQDSESEESDADTTASSSSSVASDDSRKKGKNKTAKVPVKRRTRANIQEFEDPTDAPDELPPPTTKIENPTEWWMQLCPEEELDDLRHSGKLMLLFSLLEECNAIGDKLLVFSQSLYTLDVIEVFLKRIDDYTQRKSNASEDDEDIKRQGELLSGYTGSWSMGLDYFRLDGSTSIENRNIACNHFNSDGNPRARLFLISTRAGGLGINLVAANRVVIFDVSWNPSHDIQSIFRVYRFGQVKPCYIYRFIALGTMEEKIYERQVTKLAIAKRVIDEHQIDRHYKENDLMELYKTNLVPEEPRKQPPLPKDRMFALQLQKFDKIIYKYHEHDSLLENKHEETLNEEEMKAAWEEFEAEKSRPVVTYNYNPQPRMSGMGPVTSNTIYGFRSDIMLNLLSMYARKQHPTANDTQIKQLVPLLLTQLHEKMNLGDTSMYAELVILQSQLQGSTMAFHNMIGQMNSQQRVASHPMSTYNPYAAVMNQQQYILMQAQNRLMGLTSPPAAHTTNATNTSSNQVIELD